jgi:hypothetical protein
MIQTWESLLNGPAQVAAGTAYHTSVTLTDVSPLPNTAIGANSLVPGSVIRLTAYGVLSTTGTPTILLGFYYGGVAGTALAATTAISTGSGVTNVPWKLEYQGIVRSVGASGTIMGLGEAHLGTAVSAWTSYPLPQTAMAAVTIDTTTSKNVTVGAQWGTSSASNTLTCHGILIESVA